MYDLLWFNTFKVQKPAIRIMTNAGYRESCRHGLKICLYILKYILDIHNNLSHYKTLKKFIQFIVAKI